YGTFRNGNDAESPAIPHALANRGSNFIHAIRNLWNQDHVCAARDTRPKRQPSSVMSHYFYHDNAVVAVRGAMQPINGFGGNRECRVIAEGDVGHRHVVVNRL